MPTGGPKDTIPPVLIKAIPPNESANFKGKSIELVFPELIVLNNPKEQLIITPTIGKDWDIKARKKTVKIEFENELRPNTTYTFNFRDAIQDITEKNPVKNFQYAVSTGPYVDSLSIDGTIFDILKGEEKADVIVAIHEKNDTFDIFKHPAVYSTKTNKKGAFKINHLKPDIYYIYTIEDKNRNLIADSKNEAYGFLSDSIDLKKDTSNISVGMLRLDARPLKISSARPYNTYFNIRTTKNIKDFKLSADDNSDIYYCFGEDHANINLYNTFPDRDSIAIQVTANDSIGNWLDTTVYAKFPKREVTPDKFNHKVPAAKLLADKGIIDAVVTFSKPLKEVNFDSLYFEVDSLNKVAFTREDLSWDQLYNILTIKKTVDKKLFTVEPPEQKGKKVTKDSSAVKTKKIKPLNQLYLGKGAFISIENDSSKKLIEKINPLRTEDLSEIILEVKSNEKNIVVQLLDNNFNIVREIPNQTKITFHDLPAGDYMVRVVIDRNKNGSWDPGNYMKKEQPEPLIYYFDEKRSKKITLKSNWELELAPMLISTK